MTPSAPHTPSSRSLDEETARLHRAVHELSILNDLALAIGGVQNSEEIIRTIIHRSLRAVSGAQGVITLVEDEGDLKMHTLVRTLDGTDTGVRYHVDQQLLGWMHIHKQALVIDSPATDERFRGVRWDPSIRSLLCVPLMVKSFLRGVLTIYNRTDGGHFTPEDQRLLAIIAAQSAQVLENARLLEAEKALQHMQEDLRVAARIQQDLLPRSLPEIPGYDVAGTTLPAQTVGGDYFDCFPIGAGRIALALGDVSGKGLPASLLMANVQATLRGQALWTENAGECLRRANRQLFQSTASDRFVTLFFGILDSAAHTLTYCNAGQEPPLIVQPDGPPRRLTAGGPMLGVLEEYHYEEETLSLHPGDLFVAYSDGISEAVNRDGTMVGEHGILAVLRTFSHLALVNLIAALLDNTASPAQATLLEDDRTVLAVRRHPSSS